MYATLFFCHYSSVQRTSISPLSCTYRMFERVTLWTCMALVVYHHALHNQVIWSSFCTASHKWQRLKPLKCCLLIHGILFLWQKNLDPIQIKEMRKSNQQRDLRGTHSPTVVDGLR